MNQQILYIVIAYCLSAICGAITIPQIINFCNRKKIYDIPDLRKIHKKSIPRLGGICFLPSMLLAFLVAIIIHNNTFVGKELQVSLWSVFFFVSLLIIYAAGIIDDIIGIGPKTKFSFQFVAALLLPISGLYINNLYGFCGIYQIPYIIGAPLTILVIVFIVNSINLIDGIDGLSASISFIALTGFLYCFIQAGMVAYSMLIAGLMGVLLPFLYYNIWGDEKKMQKIFMGDSGSLTLGFILAFLLIKVMMDNPDVISFSRTSVILAYSLLVVPTYDVVRVSLCRLIHKQPMFKADKNHIHHKLMRTGLNQHITLIVIICLALLFIIVNLAISTFTSLTMIVIVDVLLWLLFHFTLNKVIARKGQAVFLPANEEIIIKDQKAYISVNDYS